MKYLNVSHYTIPYLSTIYIFNFPLWLRTKCSHWFARTITGLLTLHATSGPIVWSWSRWVLHSAEWHYFRWGAGCRNAGEQITWGWPPPLQTADTRHLSLWKMVHCYRLFTPGSDSKLAPATKHPAPHHTAAEKFCNKTKRLLYRCGRKHINT